MKTPSPQSLLIFVAALALRLIPTARAGEDRYVAPKDLRVSCAVVSDCDLVHTTQVAARGDGAVPDQAREVTAALTTLLSEAGSAWENVVKINVYAPSDEDGVSVVSFLESQFERDHKPAVACVTTPLRHAGSRVAMDVIATVPKAAGRRNTATAGFLVSGPRVYISGQAEKGDGSVADSTRKTMASLGRTLDFLGLPKSQVVQVKCFLTPMSAIDEAEREIAAWFSTDKTQPAGAPADATPVCPTAFLEWKSSLPVEIEMVVSAPGFAPGPPVEVRTPPGMTPPAVFSRLTIARHPTSIYIGGLFPESSSAPANVQLRSLFFHLKQCLDATGSDWMHLVKATYFVSDEALSREHNVVRPEYFSPRRPPAASKATVRGVGLPGHGISMDFIVVPGEP